MATKRKQLAQRRLEEARIKDEQNKVIGKEKLGQRLKLLRLENGLTVADMQEALDIGYSTLAQYETGTRFPSYKNRQALAKYFDVDLGYLIGETDIRKASLFADFDYDKLSQKDKDLLEAYKDSSPKLQAIIDMMLDDSHAVEAYVERTEIQ